MPTMPCAPNLFTIGSHTPFLPRLAEAWLAGALNVGPTGDPLARIDTTFYLPTRRAARAFAATLADLQGGTALLPRIRTLADADEDEFAGLSADDPTDDPDRLAIASELFEPPNLATMPALRRRLLLTRLIEAAGEAMRRTMVAAHVSEHPIFPQSLAESAHLAKALGDVIDQVATEESDWQALFDLVPDDHAAYWQLTLTLLTLVTQNWPAILAEEGVVDPATRRRLLLDARTARIVAGKHKGPVIAAGSTGSIPATARFLAALAHADRGAVVLPGLDKTMPDEAFASLDDETPEAASHPQAGLYRLLQTMKAERADCTDLSPDPPPRQEIVSAVLLPAGATATWPDVRPTDTEAMPAMQGVALVEAAGEAEEALTIALAMRAALGRGETVALVTPDRTLARRVLSDLQRFGLTGDDSAGMPLHQTPPARLMMLAAEAWRQRFAALPLLALLKHPLCALGQAPAATRAQVRLLERLVLRGVALAPGVAALREAVARRADERSDANARPPALRRSLTEADDDTVLALIDRLEEAFAPLQGETGAFARYGEALFAVCDRIADPGNTDTPNPLYAGPAGEALAALRQELRACASVGLAADEWEAADLFAALLAEGVVRPVAALDPRLHIWGPLEARLQSIDHIILGGLNETVWPALPKASPFLSRTMQAGIGLAIPERRIGRSAHDVEQALGQPNVTLTRALKVDGAPTVASRWLQRLLAFLPEETGKALHRNGAPLAALAAAWDRPAALRSRPRPEPRPKAPPTRLSITEVETLIRDPYSVYARRVLGLEEAPGIGLPPGPAERGTLFHTLFERLTPRLDAEPVENWPAAMREEAQAMLAALDPFPQVQALWARRLAGLTAPYLAEERAWSEGLVRRHAEQAGAWGLTVAGQEVTLTGRADRIDLYEDGGAIITDFKTGATPSAKQVKAGLAPQLPLTAAMLAAGAFAGLETEAPACRAARYVKLGGTKMPVEVVAFDDLATLADEAVEQLRTLWASYLAGAPFVPFRRPERVRDGGPFHHLARVKEWRTADENGEGAGGSS